MKIDTGTNTECHAVKIAGFAKTAPRIIRALPVRSVENSCLFWCFAGSAVVRSNSTEKRRVFDNGFSLHRYRKAAGKKFRPNTL